MRKLTYLLAILFIYACKGEKKDTSQTKLISTPQGIQGLQQASANGVSSTTAAKSNLLFNPPHGEPGHTCALAVGAPLHQTAPIQAQVNTNPNTAANTTTSTASTNQKLNPKHGEPGHRCDIAVGAPLDSKPVQITQAATPQPVVTQVATTKVAKGMNPPHGQPGHRCDIAVGAPLNSKPTAVKPAQVQTPVSSEVGTAPVEAANGVKLNPKHGEPGHRCDIAVGAPLT